MNGVVLWSCAINLLHTSSRSVSGLARCGNSITLPLPNLVAQLAILLLSVLCSNYSAFIFSSSCQSISVCVLTFIVQTQIIYSCVWWPPMQSEHLPCIARFSLCVHRLSSIGFIFFLCVRIIVHVDFNLNSHDRRVWIGQSLFFYWQSSHTAPVNAIGILTDLQLQLYCTAFLVACSFWMQSWLIVRNRSRQ